MTTTTLTTPAESVSVSSSSSSVGLKERPRRSVQYISSSHPEDFARVEIPSMHYQHQFLMQNHPLREGISFVGVVHRYDGSRAQNDYEPAAVTTTDGAPEGNHQNLDPPLKSENSAEKDGMGISSEEGQLRTLLKQLLPSYPRIVVSVRIRTSVISCSRYSTLISSL